MKADRVKELLLKALKKNGGVICKACESVNISRMQYYRWLKEDAEFAEKVREVEESMIDFVENRLMTLINDGDTTATIFYLKTKGKNRGYVEKMQVDGNLNTDVRITYVSAQANISDGSNKFASREDEVED